MLSIEPSELVQSCGGYERYVTNKFSNADIRFAVVAALYIIIFSYLFACHLFNFILLTFLLPKRSISLGVSIIFGIQKTLFIYFTKNIFSYSCNY